MKLPLQNVYGPTDDEEDEEADTLYPEIREGIHEIVCDAANVRSWDSLMIRFQVYKGDKIYVFPEKKYSAGLPFRYIGAGLCVAEYDNEGTQIIGED